MRKMEWLKKGRATECLSKSGVFLKDHWAPFWEGW